MLSIVLNMALGKILLLCCVLSLAKTVASRNNKCGFSLDFSYGILGSLIFNNAAKEDTTTEMVFFSMKLPNNVTSWRLDKYPNIFVKAEVINRTLQIIPTDAFENFEYMIKSESERKEPIQLDMEFTCSKNYDNTDFTFVQPITDTNNHAPTFNRKEYLYRFGMPIKAGAVLTSFMEIYAVDVDFTNTKVKFSIEMNDEVEISYEKADKSTGKKHYAILKTKKQMATGTYTYKITAVDDANPPKANMEPAIVKIIID